MREEYILTKDGDKTIERFNVGFISTFFTHKNIFVDVIKEKDKENIFNLKIGNKKICTTDYISDFGGRLFFDDFRESVKCFELTEGESDIGNNKEVIKELKDEIKYLKKEKQDIFNHIVKLAKKVSEKKYR